MRKELIKRRFTKSLGTYHQKALTQRHIANRVAQMAFDSLPEQSDRIFEIGYGTGLLTEELIARFEVKKLFLNDLVEYFPINIKQLISEKNVVPSIDFVIGDVEKIDFPEDLNAVISSSTVQWLDDKLNFIKKSHTALKPNGMLIFNTFGPNNLAEVKELTGQGLNYLTIGDWKHWMDIYFDDVRIIQETILTPFDSPKELLQHLRLTCVTGTIADFKWTKSSFLDFQEKYYQQYAEKGKVNLTWDVIYVKGRKKQIK